MEGWIINMVLDSVDKLGIYLQTSILEGINAVTIWLECNTNNQLTYTSHFVLLLSILMRIRTTQMKCLLWSP